MNLRNTISALLVIFVILMRAPPERAFLKRQGSQVERQSKHETTIQRWSLGYWTPWGKPGIPPSAIEWDGLTHVVYAWALVRTNGSLDLDTQLVSSQGHVLVETARDHGVKALLGIAQPYWLGQTTNLQSAISGNRAKLVNNIMDVVNRYEFDGVDLDWEPFNPSINGPEMDALAADLRSRLGPMKTLSAAAIINDYTYWGSVESKYDRIGVMTYDMAGTWIPYCWHNAALYGASESLLSSLLTLSMPQPWSVDLAVKRFTQAGVPAAKLSIGLPFFGYEWKGGGVSKPGQRWMVKPDVRNIPYQSLAGSIKEGWDVQWDSTSRVPYLSVEVPGDANDRFISYDNEESIAEKIDYVKSNGLGGWIIWELSGDYFPSQTPNQPLLNVIKNVK